MDFGTLLNKTLNLAQQMYNQPGPLLHCPNWRVWPYLDSPDIGFLKSKCETHVSISIKNTKTDGSGEGYLEVYLFKELPGQWSILGHDLVAREIYFVRLFPLNSCILAFAESDLRDRPQVSDWSLSKPTEIETKFMNCLVSPDQGYVKINYILSQAGLNLI